MRSPKPNLEKQTQYNPERQQKFSPSRSIVKTVGNHNKIPVVIQMFFPFENSATEKHRFFVLLHNTRRTAKF
jgi:hypothetical protein